MGLKAAQIRPVPSRQLKLIVNALESPTLFRSISKLLAFTTSSMKWYRIISTVVEWFNIEIMLQVAVQSSAN